MDIVRTLAMSATAHSWLWLHCNETTLHNRCTLSQRSGCSVHFLADRALAARSTYLHHRLSKGRACIDEYRMLIVSIRIGSVKHYARTRHRYRIARIQRLRYRYVNTVKLLIEAGSAKDSTQPRYPPGSNL